MSQINSTRHANQQRALLPCRSSDGSKFYTSSATQLHSSQTEDQPFLVTPGADSSFSQELGNDIAHRRPSSSQIHPSSMPSSSQEGRYHSYDQSLRQSNLSQGENHNNDLNGHHQYLARPASFDEPRRVSEPSSPGSGSDFRPHQESSYLRSPNGTKITNGSNDGDANPQSIRYNPSPEQQVSVHTNFGRHLNDNDDSTQVVCKTTKSNSLLPFKTVVKDNNVDKNLKRRVNESNSIKAPLPINNEIIHDSPKEEKEMLSDALLLAEVAAMARTELNEKETSDARSTITNSSSRECSSTPVHFDQNSNGPSLITPRLTSPSHPVTAVQSTKIVHDNVRPPEHFDERHAPPRHPLSLPLEDTHPEAGVVRKEMSHLPPRSSFPRMRPIMRNPRYEDDRAPEAIPRRVSEPYYDADYHHGYESHHDFNETRRRQSVPLHENGEFEPPRTNGRQSPYQYQYRDRVYNQELHRPYVRRSLSQNEYSMLRHDDRRRSMERTEGRDRHNEPNQYLPRHEDIRERYSPGSYSPNRNPPPHVHMGGYQRPPPCPPRMIHPNDRVPSRIDEGRQYVHYPHRRLSEPYQEHPRVVQRQFETPIAPDTTSLQGRSSTYDKVAYVSGQPKKTILRRKCAWKNYPELENFLIENREEYLRHSAMNYTIQQKQYNNQLTERLLEVAAKHNYVFDENDFNFVAVRDRIRCYYKSYVQSSKKRGILVGYGAQQKNKKLKMNEENEGGNKTDEARKHDEKSDETKHREDNGTHEEKKCET